MRFLYLAGSPTDGWECDTARLPPPPPDGPGVGRPPNNDGALADTEGAGRSPNSELACPVAGLDPAVSAAGWAEAGGGNPPKRSIVAARKRQKERWLESPGQAGHRSAGTGVGIPEKPANHGARAHGTSGKRWRHLLPQPER